MNSQNELFHEDWRDSMRHLVKALGGVETVGIHLWPAKTRKAAGGWLSDCLNPERPAKLDLEEISQLIGMGREANVMCAIHQLCDENGLTHPTAATPKSPKTVLLERQSQLVDAQLRIQKDLDRLAASEALKVVRQ